MPKLKIGIFVDAENVAARHWTEVAAHAAATGYVLRAQIFGDFTEDRLGRWLDLARTEGLQPMLQLSGGKNCSDIAIVIAAMDALHDGALNAVSLVTSDQDFAPLVQRLRAAGLHVFGFGLANTPESLRRACTQFTVLGSATSATKLAAVG